MGCRLWGRTELDMTEATEHACTHCVPGFLPGAGLKGTDRIPHSLTKLIFQQTHAEPDPALGMQRRAEPLPS